MAVEVHEQLPVREPVGEQVTGVHGEGRLPDAGHSVDHVDRQGVTDLLSAADRAHQRVEFGRAVGERRGVAR